MNAHLGDAGGSGANVLPLAARVPGNDWRKLPVDAAEDFEAHLSASVVVPYFEAPDELRLTLAALEQQSYPHELIEVVVVDDGSAQPCEQIADSALSVKVVWQEDLGFGLARARNTGVRASSGDIVVFLDCDMMPERNWLMSHARWHHAACDVLTLGFRAHVDVAGIDAEAVRRRPGTLEDLFRGRAVDRPEWIEFHMARTDDLTSDADDLFRVVTGGNLGIGRSFFDLVGGFDESFTQWGCEDIEFGYRAFTRGGLLVPARDAMCWHQGPGAAPDADEVASLELQRAKISQLIAHHGFRRAKPGRSFTVPQHVVVVEDGGVDAERLLGTVEGLLACDVHDLVVWVDEAIESPADDAQQHGADIEFERFRRLVSGDPRVRIGAAAAALGSYPHAAFLSRVRAGAVLSGNEMSRLVRRLGRGVSAELSLADGSSMRITRSRMLHRQTRTGFMPTADDAGETPTGGMPRSAEVSASESASAAVPAPASRPGRSPAAGGAAARGSSSGRYRKAARVLMLMFREFVRVRSVADARRVSRSFCRFVGAAIRWRIRWVAWKARAALRRAAWGIRRAPSTWQAIRQSKRTASPATYRLQPAICALGARSEAVFAASTRVESSVGPSAQLVLLDAEQADPRAGGGIAADVPCLVLDDLDAHLQTPAFDAEQINPLNLPYRRRRRPAAFGASGLLPGALRARRSVAPDRPMAARRFQYVADAAAHHATAHQRAGALAAAAAAGAVVYISEDNADGASPTAAADGEPGIRLLLGDTLYRLMNSELAVTASEHEREALSVAVRREALRTHSLRARARQVGMAAGLATAELPKVSVLLATRRPHQLAEACGAAAKQTYPSLQLVLALHGDGFADAEVERASASFAGECKVVRCDASATLGEVLNAAVAESTGALLTKFDDDDLYGAEHVWDLVLAHEYSKATLVGKAAEFVYLERSQRTVRRFGGGGERLGSDLSLAGGAMLISRHDLAALGGWQPVASGVDQALMQDVRGAGRRMYRTHGLGYMLVRHGDAHTWDVGDDYFASQAGQDRHGCDLQFAGITDLAPQ